MISILPILGLPIVQSEEELWKEFEDKICTIIQPGDILVCAHTPWSRIRGPIFQLDKVIPSDKAINIAKELDKPANKIEIILKLSKKIVKTGRNVIISENKAGIVCANAGADESNAGLGMVLGVPDDPDTLAREIKDFIFDKTKKNVAVIISDTVGRALRRGAVNIAIGVAGLPAMKSEIGKKDLFGYEMRVSEIAIADELASAAELLQGQTDEGVPMVLIRGYKINFQGEQSAHILNRPEDERLFK